MSDLIEHDVACPYCGEIITLEVDASVARQSYVEDCQVCCRAMELDVAAAPDGSVRVTARQENE